MSVINETNHPNHRIVHVRDMSNEEFIRDYAAPGRIGLSGGSTWIDRAIRAAERRLDEDRNWSRFSHAFIFQGKRLDGHHWVMESDIQLIRKHITLGVQENRATKYHDQELYHTLAVMDFGLAEDHVETLLKTGLELIATKTRYSIRELVGTWLALMNPEDRTEENKLSRDHSLYCSAFVQHLYRRINVEFIPGVTDKNTSPEDIFRTNIPHTTYLLERPREKKGIVKAASVIRDRLRARSKMKKK